MKPVKLRKYYYVVVDDRGHLASDYISTTVSEAKRNFRHENYGIEWERMEGSFRVIKVKVTECQSGGVEEDEMKKPTLKELRQLAKEAGVEIIIDYMACMGYEAKQWKIYHNKEYVARAQVYTTHRCRVNLKAYLLGIIAMRERGELK